MKTGSKRGAALAYVIVVSAALMILATALLFSAKQNLDLSKNSLEGRQAYLDAKSAIEYGRAYVLKNPGTGDFAIVKNSGDLGFTVGSSGDAGAVAVYNSAKKLISASAKYRSSDRVRKLGYQFTTAEGGDSDGSHLNDFLVASNGYGRNEIFYTYTQTFLPDAASVYPVVSHLYRMTTGNNKLTAPQIYILGKSNGNSVIIYDSNELTLKSDFIYLAGGIDSFESWLHVYQPFYLQTYSGSTRGVVFFGKDVIKDGATIAQGGKYYYFKNNINLYHLAAGDLEEVEESKLPACVDQESVDFIVNNNDNLITGDSWSPNRGSNWSSQGIISGILLNHYRNSGSGNVPPYVAYQKPIEQGSKIESGVLYPVNSNSHHYNEDEQVVFWYLNDISGWASALLGNNNPLVDNVFTNVSNVYYAKEINLLYVNTDTDFKVPEYKTVVLKADKITLGMKRSDTEGSSGDSRPKITHFGNAARFILEAQNESASLQLYVPYPVKVQYRDGGNTREYQIKVGHYEVKELNLFSDEAKDFFSDAEPGSGSPGGPGGSDGETEITGGVYTDGQ